MEMEICCIIFLILMSACGKVQGLEGQQGPSGTSCAVSKLDSVTTIKCPGSPDVTVSDGQAGATGSTGAQGNAGTNATPVAMIQLCTGYTTVFPTDFPEYGICIQDQLYGVFNQSSKSWLALIVPGTYSSTSYSSPCTVVVSAHCGVFTQSH